MAALMEILGGAALRRERVFRDRTNPLDIYDDQEMFKKYRFDRTGALHIINELSQDLQHPTQRSRALPAHLQVFVALRFYATGSVLDSAATIHGCSISTVSRVVRKVTQVLCAKMNEFIKFPCSEEEVRETQLAFYRLAGFPKVVAAVDGTHVRIHGVSLGEAHRAYMNRKGFHSINVQLTCNANYVITSVSARWPGSTHDSRIFANSIVGQGFAAGVLNGLILGDSGYALQPYLMTPVPLPATRAERRYNQAHSCTRVVIEQVNGQLKSKFRCLTGSGLHMFPERAGDIITACACLHNVSKQLKQPEVHEDNRADVDDMEEREEEGDAPSGRQVRSDIINNFFA